MRLAGFVLFLACAFAAQAEELSGDGLAAALRRGGYILYLRHTSTDFSKNDQSMTSFEDCASQRNLTDKGRDEARALGEQIKRLRIPIGEVLASPFCRTVETAMLAFGSARKSPDVRGGPGQPEDPRRYDALRRLLASKVKPGQNLAIASHGNPFYAVFGPPYLAEGEIAVVRPLGGGRSEIVARVRPEGWAALK